MGRAEGYVENYMRTQCRRNGILCYKFVSPGWRGVPDDILIYNSRVVFVETKSSTGTLSVIQKKRIADMKAAGADVRVCHTRQSIDDLLQELLTTPSANRKHGCKKETSAKKGGTRCQKKILSKETKN